MTIKNYVAALALATAGTLANAGDLSLVGQWTSSDEGAGTFMYRADGVFVWTDGAVINMGTWLYDPSAHTVGMILDPSAGIDDLAKLTKLDDGSIEFSFIQVGREALEAPWVATYSLVEK